MNNLPKYRPARNLRAVPAKPYAWRPATPIEHRYQSWQILKVLRGFKVAGMERFFHSILANSGMVQAYFEPRVLPVDFGKAAGQINVMPFEESVSAAGKAKCFDILLRKEQGLAEVAAFLHGAGLYFITSSLGRDTCPDAKVSAHAAHEHNRAWLEDPLRALRSSNPALGATLTAGMEMGDFGECDPEQVARLITARRLANLGIEEL
jgi:hypothetical protein